MTDLGSSGTAFHALFRHPPANSLVPTGLLCNTATPALHVPLTSHPPEQGRILMVAWMQERRKVSTRRAKVGDDAQ